VEATKSITAENQFTDSINPKLTDIAPTDAEYRIPARRDYGNLNLSISGTWVGTVTLQRMFPDTAEWQDVATYTENAEKSITDYEPGVIYRAGIKTGAFTSGTCNVRLSK